MERSEITGKDSAPTAAFRQIADAKSEHYRLTQLGHVVFEGKLIPAEERDRILAEREAARQRRLDEQKRIAEERKRERLRLLEEKRLAEVRAREKKEEERARAAEEERQREEAASREQTNRINAYLDMVRQHRQRPYFHRGLGVQVGAIAYADGRVLQILGPDQMLFQLKNSYAPYYANEAVVLVSGLTTEGHVDREQWELPLMQVVGTTAYTTTAGSERTVNVFLLMRKSL